MALGLSSQVIQYLGYLKVSGSLGIRTFDYLFHVFRHWDVAAVQAEGLF